MKFKLKKRGKFKYLLTILTFSLFFSFFLAKNVAALDNRLLKEKEDRIELSEQETSLILKSLTTQIVKNRISNIISSGPPEEEAVLVILRMGINKNSLKYAMIQAPKEVAADFLKIGVKITSLATDPTFSSFLKIGTDELKKHAIEWLVKNELRIGSGNFSLSSYKTYDGDIASETLPYILAYNPNNNKVEIKIYSPTRIKPPRNEGGLSRNHWNQEEWIKGGNTTLPPFTINVKGEIIKGNYGGYRWISGPSIEIDLSSPVPEFELRELTLINRELSSLNKALIAAKRALEMVQGVIDTTKSTVSNVSQNIWEGIKSGISKIGSMGEAAITSVLFSPTERSTIISLREEVNKIEKTDENIFTENNISDENSNKLVEELRKRILDLENELKKSFQENDDEIENLVITRVNINNASKDDLTKIIHIGPARAKEIIKLRPFRSIDDLIRTPGIGEKIVMDIKIQGIAYVDIIDDIIELENEKIEEEIEKEELKEIVLKENPCDHGVDINNANLKDLTYITGVGEAIAQRIIDHRIYNTFYTIDDLLSINGIGPVTLQKIKEQGCAYANTSLPGNIKNSPKKEENDNKDDPIEDLSCSINSIEINTANKDDLQKIVNIGLAYANQIISLRLESPFVNLDDLARVSGISLGGARLNEIKEQGCAYVDTSLLPKEEVLEIIIEGAESIWSPSLSLDYQIIDTLPPSQSLSGIFISHNESEWTLDLNPWEDSAITPPNLSDIFISHNESDWTQIMDEEITETLSINKENDDLSLSGEFKEKIPIDKPRRNGK